jgi:FecR protein
MNDDYLWDGSGKPDPEIQKLEESLGRFRHKPGRAPDFQSAPLLTAAPRRSTLARRWPVWMGIAATLALGVAGWLAMRASKHSAPSQPNAPQIAWDVSSLAGEPRVAGTVIRQTGAPGKLGVGQTLETDDHSRANISLEGTGEVQIETGSRVRLVGTVAPYQRLALDRGTIQATIWASPGDFAVETPSAIAVDLGCAYTLSVDDSGAGILRTSLGWVGFRANGRESFIPAGAVCATRPRIGPGTPYYEDAAALFREALARFDFESGAAAEQSSEIAQVVAGARKRDALTLWHLLPRTTGANRARVYDRLAALVPPPAQVTRAGVLQLDQHMLDLWWAQLGYGDVSLWRNWERAWSSDSSAAAPGAAEK